MSSAASPQLKNLARVNGVQTSYVDVDGQEQPAAPAVLAAVLRALGVPAGNARELRESIHATPSRPPVEPVVVAWDQRPAILRVGAPAAVRRKVRGRLWLEDGTVRDCHPSPGRLPRGGTAVQFSLGRLPFGYHRLETETGDGIYKTLVLSAPVRTYAEPGFHSWGIFLPAYAAHSKKSWGAGNFSDWQQLCQWLGSFGDAVAGTLPLLASFLDWPVCEPGPYSPASRLFWNEFYLDIPGIPEFARCAAARKRVASASFQERLRAFRRSALIDYPAEWAARREVLELLADCFFKKPSTRTAEFERFLRQRPEVEDYARFRAVCDRAKKSWSHWPERLRDGVLRDGDYDERRRRFHLYVQWLAQEQVNALNDSSRRGVKLYLDLPLGVNPAGYDVWRHRDSFALNASVGAPPDSFFTAGQNWGFSPLHPRRVREQGYGHYLDFLRFQMRHARLLRIDHVMGLHRLYWVPKGFSSGEGAYVNYPAEEYYAMLSLESHRHRTMIVGENLGTVPRAVNAGMRRHLVRGMSVVQYELRSDPATALRRPPAQSVAGLNTHDMPTFAAYWAGLDIQDRCRLGLIAKKDVARARAERRELKAALIQFLFRHRSRSKLRTSDPRAVLSAILLWLSAGPAEIVLVALEDLWLEKLPQNVPGTSTERPNWRRKSRFTLEEIQRHTGVRNALQAMARLRESPHSNVSPKRPR